VIRTNVTLQTVTDNSHKILESLKKIKELDVLVGIPQEKSSRKGQEITNVELAFLHSKGFKSPKSALLGSYKKRFEGNKRKGKALAAMQAYFMEKGDPYWHVPARPFLEPALKANKDALLKQQDNILKAALNGDYAKAEIEAEKLGILASNFVREWFTDPRNGWAENHPLIVALKGSARPLIDTGALRQAVTYVLRKNHA
jgi:hypothetical protein